MSTQSEDVVKAFGTNGPEQTLFTSQVSARCFHGALLLGSGSLDGRRR